MPVEPSALSSRLTSLLERIDRAARLSGRSLSDVTLVAVTKTVSSPLIREAHRLGLRHFGENRVQDTEAKRPELEDLADVHWHMIGHLQTNKVTKAVGLFDAFQSVDSVRLAETLNRAAEAAGRVLPCLVEVKTSEEPAKHGLPPEQLDEFLAQGGRWPGLKLEGLMTVAPYSDDPASARPYFARLRALADGRRDVFGAAPRLSMGMSQDFEAAVLEGSTMVRVGTSLFGDRS